MLGALQHIGLGANFHHVAQAQHRHPMRHLGHHAKVMGDEQHAGAVAVLQVKHQLENLGLGGDVERGGGFIGDQQHRVKHQGHRDHDALALAARQLVRVAGDHAFGVGQQHLAHDGQHLLAPLGGRQFGVLAQHLVDLVAAGHHRIERRHRLLKDHAHAGGAQLTQARQRRMGDVFALQQNLAGFHWQLARQQAHHALGNDAFA